MHTYDLKLRAQDRVDAYHLVDANGMAWATAYVDDKRQALTLITDWGVFGHRWPGYFGDKTPTVTEFLAGRTHYDYVIGKLLGDKRWVFSLDRTVARFREMIVEKRRHQSGRLDKETARELWDAVGDLDGSTDFREFHDRLPGVIHDHFCDLYEDGRDEPSGEAVALETWILPVLFAALGAECERRRTGAAAVGAMIHALGAWAVACDVREPLRLLYEEMHALHAKRRGPGLEPAEVERLYEVLTAIDKLEARERGPALPRLTGSHVLDALKGIGQAAMASVVVRDQRAEIDRLQAELTRVLGAEPPVTAPLATNLTDATLALLQAGEAIGALVVADRLAPGALSPWLVKQLRTAHRWIRRVLPDADPSKRRLVSDLLTDGHAVNLRINGRHPGVVLPAHLAELPAIDLLIGRHLQPPLPDLVIDDYQVTATCTFPGGLTWPCVVPWGAVYAACPQAEGARTLTWPEAFPAELAATAGPTAN